MATPEPRCRKCQSEPGARPKRHARKCPLRGIGTSRRNTDYYWRACSRAKRNAYLDVVQPAPAWQERVELAIAAFERDVARWGRGRRWLLKHRLGGSARAAFEALDRYASVREWGLDPVLSYPVPPLVLTPVEWGEEIGGRLLTLPRWVVSVAPPDHAHLLTLRFRRPRPPPSPLKEPLSRFSFHPDDRMFYAHRFRDARFELHVFLPDGVGATDEIAAQLQSVVELFDIARVAMPGRTEADIARALLLNKRLFRGAVEMRVRAMYPRARGWQRERALLAEAMKLLANARSALAEAARHAGAEQEASR